MTVATGALDLAPRWSRARKFMAILAGTLAAGGAAFAASNWIVGLNSGSNGQGKSAAVSNLTITAVSSPSPANLLYPKGTGDVVVKITNPNSFPVTITKLKLPKTTAFAAGYTTSSLGSTKTGCGASKTGSDVSWHYATSTTGTAHTLTTPLVVNATGKTGDPLSVTLTSDAVMGTTASATCEGIYFKMPSFTGVTATAGGTSPTTSPATDGWTS
jgi:hypothetical protein